MRSEGVLGGHGAGRQSILQLLAFAFPAVVFGSGSGHAERSEASRVAQHIMLITAPREMLRCALHDFLLPFPDVDIAADCLERKRGTAAVGTALDGLAAQVFHAATAA